MTALYGPSTRPEGFPVLPDAIRTVPFQQVTGPDTGRQFAALAALAVTSADTYPVPVVEPEPQPAGAPRRMSRNDKLLLAGIYVALVAANVAIFPPLRHEVMAGYDRAWPGALAAPAAGVAVLGWRARSKVRAFAVALAGAAPWPLLAVLTVQAVLSLRLVWTNTASTDEALYLWAGHLEWAHWLHGTRLPLLPTYFSGAPAIYPPAGALADSVGGLAAARMLSLCFMLGATALLWGTTSRLYGRLAGFFAIALWAFLGPTLKLGAYATFDAMSLFLVALAAWCATARRADEDATGWVFAGAVALALANATKYASTIFDPVVILLAVFAAWPYSPSKAALRRGVLLTTCAFGLLYLAIRLAGTYYATGVNQTTLTRVSSTDTAASVLMHAVWWIGPAVALALIGLALGVLRAEEWQRSVLLAVFAGAALLAPLEQARIHTLTSLEKHADFGAWFAAVAAGYALSKIVTWFSPGRLRAAATVATTGIIAGIIAVTGSAQAQILFHEWPDATSFISTIRPLVARTHGAVLVEVSPLAEYYLPSGKEWNRWSNTYSIQLLSGRTAGYSPGAVNTAGNRAIYSNFIARGYFSLIVINFGATPELDRDIESDLQRSRLYHVVAWVSYSGGRYPVWAHRRNR